MSGAGKVKVVVRSRRVPVRTVEFSSRLNYIQGATSPGNGVVPGFQTRRAVIYESVLDDEHRRAIEEGDRLACNLGLELEVIDQSRFGLFRRVLSSLGRDGSGNVGVVVSPPLAGRPVNSSLSLVECG